MSVEGGSKKRASNNTGIARHVWRMLTLIGATCDTERKRAQHDSTADPGMTKAGPLYRIERTLVVASWVL